MPVPVTVGSGFDFASADLLQVCMHGMHLFIKTRIFVTTNVDFVLNTAACDAVTLMQTWQQSKTSKERQKVAEDIAKTLQNITGAEAQGLPNKDPETIDSSGGICSRYMCCC